MRLEIMSLCVLTSCHPASWHRVNLYHDVMLSMSKHRIMSTSCHQIPSVLVLHDFRSCLMVLLWVSMSTSTLSPCTLFSSAFFWAWCNFCIILLVLHNFASFCVLFDYITSFYIFLSAYTWFCMLVSIFALFCVFCQFWHYFACSGWFLHCLTWNSKFCINLCDLHSFCIVSRAFILTIRWSTRFRIS